MKIFLAGLPALGMLPIDPMEITEMSLVQGSGPVNVELMFKNTSLFGFKDSKFLRVG